MSRLVGLAAWVWVAAALTLYLWQFRDLAAQMLGRVGQ